MSSGTRRVTILSPVRGEDGRRFPSLGHLGPHTVNVLPDNRGYLYGYRGGQNVLFATPAEWVGLKVVQSAAFVNRLGIKKRVFVTDDWQAWDLRGDTPVLLKQFSGEVKLLNYAGFMLFLSIDEPPYKWDGIEGVTFLGVRETPRAPEVRVALGAHGMWADYFRRPNTWGMDNLDPLDEEFPKYVPPSPTQDRNPLKDDQLDRKYEWALSFYNTSGQIGRMSSPTTFIVQRSGDIELDRTDWTSEEDEWSPHNFIWPIVEWAPDFSQEDIAGVVVWRTIDEHEADQAGVFQLAYALPLPISRITDTKADGALSEVYDALSGYPGPSGKIGCVFKSHIMISGDPEDPNSVRYSKAGFPEDWPILNSYRASDVVTALVPLSKSLVVVTRSSIETLQLLDNGTFANARTEATKGSRYGNTLIAYKDNVLGFFNSGFGVFDGFTFKSMNNTLGYLSEEVEEDDGAFAWISPDGMYFTATQTRGRGQQILCYHFSFNAWFRLDETNAFCVLVEDNDVFLGALGNLKAFNKDESGSGEIEFIIPGSLGVDDALDWFRKDFGRLGLYYASMGDWNYTIEGYADEDYASDAFFDGLIEAADADETKWNDADFTWDNKAKWSGPRFKWRWVKKAIGGDSWERLSLRIKWTGDIMLGGVALEVEYKDPT